jgi:hypothetical protein
MYPTKILMAKMNETNVLIVFFKPMAKYGNNFLKNHFVAAV